jgi:predicted nucleic acid-binding protein
MPFVLDASVATCWAFADQDHAVARLALERIRTDEALVPSLWWFEIRNALIISERRGQLTAADSGFFLRELSRLRVTVDRSPEEASVMALARKHRLTVYDACYLELAERQNLALATLDSDLIRVAHEEKRPLINAAL